MDNYRNTKRKLPVLLGEQQHIMASADIYRTPEKVLVQITCTGQESQLFAEFLEQAEPIALYFGAVPVQNDREKRENT